MLPQNEVKRESTGSLQPNLAASSAGGAITMPRCYHVNFLN